jgi:hypothetical protein
MLQPKLLKHLIEVLDENHIAYMVTGSLVSSLQGEPRATHDIDIVVQIPPASIPALIRSFPPPGYYLSESSIKDALIHKTMFNLLDTREGDKVDFWILTNEPFDLSRFNRRYAIEVFGIRMNVSRPEDTILAKLRWAKLAGGSEKQFTDALRVFEVQAGEIDLSYIEAWVMKLGVEELWKKLKDEAQPIDF